ncbi:ATP-binding cassette domain-containing protein [Pseudonocardia sp. RS11V-5]|uniref:ABC transporter ATP-binding protein n=1 Tax=Pseudonocardia terrae TaxID=2905831 RepID=UPI001E5A880F|nr:ABC transporter ATP-binding protein [Pseudonocardia terrae]MCE3551762.1 ATP-binding cassette domain-containing protein [Pseudonocardia terrae]
MPSPTARHRATRRGSRRATRPLTETAETTETTETPDALDPDPGPEPTPESFPAVTLPSADLVTSDDDSRAVAVEPHREADAQPGAEPGAEPDTGPGPGAPDRSAGALLPEAPHLTVRQIFRRFWPYTAGFRGRFAVGLILSALSPLTIAASLWLFMILIDDVLTPQNYTLLPWVIGAYLAVSVVGAVVDYFDSYVSAWVGERFVLVLRTRVFAHLQRLSLGFFERRQLGDVMSRLSSDIGAIEELVLTGVAMAVTYGVQVIVFTALLFFLNWQLALIAIAAAPVFGLASRFFARRIKSASREKRRRTGGIAAVAEESLGNVALVQAYGRQAAETERFHRESRGAFAAQMVAVRLKSLFGPLVGMLEVVGVLTVLGVGIWQMARGNLTLGGLLVFTGYLSQLFGPVRGFGEMGNTVYAAAAGAERVIELLDEQPRVTDRPDPVRIERARGDLRLEDVTFTYPGTTGTALERVSILVPRGHTVAVVGPSGAGKTTLTKLLLRFYDPDAGAVVLDGHDLRDLALADVRRNVAAVLQETLVFDGTVRDNILWGRPDASEAEIVEAARAADAHEFISALPDGYDTRVGQRGRLLSGGQRQRLAIARAMVRDAPVLILDEPTTGLDAGATERILTPLRRLMAGRTTLVISHNLLTVTDADQIVYLENGRITASGRHRELLTRSPGYAELYRLHHPGAEPLAERLPATLHSGFGEFGDGFGIGIEDGYGDGYGDDLAADLDADLAALETSSWPADPWAETALLPTFRTAGAHVGLSELAPVSGPEALSRWALPARCTGVTEFRPAPVAGATSGPDVAPTERFAAVTRTSEVPGGRHRARIDGVEFDGVGVDDVDGDRTGWSVRPGGPR